MNCVLYLLDYNWDFNIIVLDIRFMRWMYKLYRCLGELFVSYVWIRDLVLLCRLEFEDFLF